MTKSDSLGEGTHVLVVELRRGGRGPWEGGEGQAALERQGGGPPGFSDSLCTLEPAAAAGSRGNKAWEPGLPLKLHSDQESLFLVKYSTLVLFGQFCSIFTVLIPRLHS